MKESAGLTAVCTEKSRDAPCIWLLSRERSAGSATGITANCMRNSREENRITLEKAGEKHNTYIVSFDLELHTGCCRLKSVIVGAGYGLLLCSVM